MLVLTANYFPLKGRIAKRLSNYGKTGLGKKLTLLLRTRDTITAILEILSNQKMLFPLFHIKEFICLMTPILTPEDFYDTKIYRNGILLKGFLADLRKIKELPCVLISLIPPSSALSHWLLLNYLNYFVNSAIYLITKV